MNTDTLRRNAMAVIVNNSVNLPKLFDEASSASQNGEFAFITDIQLTPSELTYLKHLGYSVFYMSSDTDLNKFKISF